jgi:hypothetical protein
MHLVKFGHRPAYSTDALSWTLADERSSGLRFNSSATNVKPKLKTVFKSYSGPNAGNSCITVSTAWRTLLKIHFKMHFCITKLS